MRKNSKSPGRPSKGERYRVAGYVRQDIFERFEALRKQYPRLNQTDLVEAAVAYYLQHADSGLDANLLPLSQGTTQHAMPEKKRPARKAG